MWVSQYSSWCFLFFLPDLSDYHCFDLVSWLGLPWWLSGKEPACQCRRREFDLWFGKIPCRCKWLPTPVFLPGKSHEQGSLVGYSPWGHKESDMTQWLNNNNIVASSHLQEHCRLCPVGLTSCVCLPRWPGSRPKSFKSLICLLGASFVKPVP